MHNMAAVQLVGYMYDRPNASGYTRYANIMRNSGAGTTLLPYRVMRGLAVSGADAEGVGVGLDAVAANVLD